MATKQTVTASGNSSPVYARRDCSLVLYSANWASESAALEHSDNNSDWQASKDSAGDAISVTANDTFSVRGGFHYRINKSGATASIRMELVESPAASDT